MADNPFKLKNFFLRKGFVLEFEESFESFGDYIFEMSSPYLRLRMVSDRSLEYIEVCSLKAKDDWYDLGLVKSYLLNEVNLAEHTAVEIAMIFFEIHFDKIKDLLSDENYSNTKAELDIMRKIRAKQMFPMWYE